jgi:ferredoxin
MRTKGFVVYCSPAGATRHAAQIIEQALMDRGVEVNTLDLGLSRNHAPFLEMIRTAGKGHCLFVGSPVYRDVAVPPMMEMIEALPAASGAAAVPFVTWGAVTSGIALWQMGRALMQKGYVLAGAAAVVSEHCMMWRSTAPLGAGRPDVDDDRKVAAMVHSVVERLQQGGSATLALDTLDYQQKAHAREMRQTLDQPWMIVPKSVDEEKCTMCGICVEECPVGAVSLAPLPVFEKNCFDCFNCIRLCPEEAIDTPLTAGSIEAHIAQLKAKYREAPETRVFLSP